MSRLYASVTGLSNIFSVSLQMAHSSASATLIVECKDKGTLEINDYITLDLGYSDNHEVLFKGYVKSIERKIPQNVFTITCNDRLVRAADFFVVSSNPEEPVKYHNITAEDLVYNVLHLAGILHSQFSADESHFTFAINTDAEVNLVSAYDYARMISNVIAWELWCDENGVIQFRNRKPYVMDGHSGQPGDHADTSIGTIYDNSILNIAYSWSDRDLRNRVVVYGTTGIYAEASEESPYLPDDFYKSACVATPIIDEVSEAQDSADYNLALLNKLTEQVSLTLIGDPLYTARKVITLASTYFADINGDWYIYSAEHTWSKSGYVTNLVLRR